MGKHMWAAIIMVPVEIVRTPLNGLDIFTSEGAEEIAREEAAVACWNCDMRPTTDNLDDECVMVDSDAIRSN